MRYLIKFIQIFSERKELKKIVSRIHKALRNISISFSIV